MHGAIPGDPLEVGIEESAVINAMLSYTLAGQADSPPALEAPRQAVFAARAGLERLEASAIG